MAETRERERERDYTYPALRLIQVLPGHPLADAKDETVSTEHHDRAARAANLVVHGFPEQNQENPVARATGFSWFCSGKPCTTAVAMFVAASYWFPATCDSICF